MIFKTHFKMSQLIISNKYKSNNFDEENFKFHL